MRYMIITFNYKDGEKLMDFDYVISVLEKENADNHNDYQRSPLNLVGDPSATRTRDTLIKSRY